MQLSHSRTGHGPVLVLIHGIGHRHQGWRPVIRRLESRRDVVAIDLPGFGASPMPPLGTPPGVGSLTDLVEGFLAELNLDRPHVAGNSLGGGIALELARRGRVASAVALSPVGFASRAEAAWAHGSLWISRRAARRLDGRVEAVAELPGGLKLAFGQLLQHPERVPMPELAADVHALAVCPWFNATLPVIIHHRFSGGAPIGVPVTVGWGEHDRLLLPRQAERAARALPQADRATLSDCGHVPFYDDPDQVAGVLLRASGG